jgi:hypothetical protein
MNTKDERGSDSMNFGARIAEIRVTVAKMWRKEVIWTYLEFLKSG